MSTISHVAHNDRELATCLLSLSENFSSAVAAYLRTGDASRLQMLKPAIDAFPVSEISDQSLRDIDDLPGDPMGVVEAGIGASSWVVDRDMGNNLRRPPSRH